MKTQLYTTASDPDEEIAIIHRNADATFAVIDVDGGGTLSKSEFTNHLSVSGYNIDIINKIFNKMDVNKRLIRMRKFHVRNFVMVWYCW